jgi:tetratricopeptide (TPR) repeat protein
MIRGIGKVAVVVMLLGGVGNCWGQEGLLSELYGRGVHAFFSRNYSLAYDLLTEAIRNQSADPRVYYFRGLALRRLGRPDEARDDFQKGAELELSGGEAYPVARSLERIQGADRAVLEEQRRLVRLQQFKVQSAQTKARYEQAKRAEAEAVRNPARSVPAGSPAPKQPDASDPFGGTNGTKVPPARLPAAAAEASPVPPPAAAEEAKPAPAQPAAPPAAAPAKPATPKPAAAPEADPFATPAAPPKPAPAPAPADDPFK